MHANLQSHAIGIQFDSECTVIPVYTLLQTPPAQGFRNQSYPRSDWSSHSSQYLVLEHQHHSPRLHHTLLLDPLMDCWAVVCQLFEKLTELKSENVDVKKKHQNNDWYKVLKFTV